VYTESEPALFRNDVHHGKDAPQLSLLNDTLQRKVALLNDNRVRRTAAHHCFHQSQCALMRGAVRLAPEASHMPYG